MKHELKKQLEREKLEEENKNLRESLTKAGKNFSDLGYDIISEKVDNHWKETQIKELENATSILAGLLIIFFLSTVILALILLL